MACVLVMTHRGMLAAGIGWMRPMARVLHRRRVIRRCCPVLAVKRGMARLRPGCRARGAVTPVAAPGQRCFELPGAGHRRVVAKVSHAPGAVQVDARHSGKGLQVLLQVCVLRRIVGIAEIDFRDARGGLCAMTRRGVVLVM